MKKICVLAILTSLTISSASSSDRDDLIDTHSSPHLTISFPEDKTQWQETTLNFLTPVLASPEVKNKLQELLDFTMPVSGQFDPINVVLAGKKQL